MNTFPHNQGILESGREELPRARAFLAAALRAHELLSQQLAMSLTETGSSPPEGGAFREPLQEAFTHTLFYLAQVHGSMGDARTSAVFCYKTLAQQVRIRRRH